MTKISILSKLKNFFNGYDNTSVSSILTNSSDYLEEKIEVKEFDVYEHYYIFEVNLPGDEIIIPDGYELVTYVDQYGYRMDSADNFVGPLFVECANNVPVKARIDRYKPPYGMNGYKYAGNPIKKNIGSVKR